MIGLTKCFKNKNNDNNNNNDNEDNNNKAMSFKVIDNKLLKKYTTIWRNKIRNLVGEEFDSKLIYDDNDKYIKTKIKVFGDKVNTNFQGKKVPRQNTPCEYLSLTMLDSAIRSSKSVILKHF